MSQRYAQLFAVLLLLTAVAAAAQPTTVQVSPISGDPVGSGTALLNALAGITDNSASKPYVIRLDPGTYNVLNTQLVMKPYVDIEGSGQASTVIFGLGNVDNNYLTAVIQAAAPAELRNLQVVSQGFGQTTSIGILALHVATSIRDVTVVAGNATNNWGIRSIGGSPTIQNVTVTVSSGGTVSYGIYTSSSSANPIIKRTVINLSCSGGWAYGLYSDGVSAPQELRDLEIAVTNSGTGAYGIYVDQFGSGQTFLLTGSTVSASGASYNDGIVFYGGTGGVFNVKTSYLKATGTSSWGFYASYTYGLSFNHSEVSGNYSIYALGTNVYVGASRLAGSVTGAAVTCAGAYNQYYAPLNASCH
jgi:hypothetical protein